MNIEGLAYWAAFFIPLILLVMTGFIRKLVDGKDFRREHWYLGIDLTVYFLASTLVNFLDIAKASHPNEQSMVWTAVLVAGAVVMLFFQAGIHQTWQPREQKSKMQLFMLCFFANSLGIFMLYGFVKLKTRGLI
ncbi:hypothetical protein [Terriglobus sp.]|uniref:hypothetical protein n=1 Tax=Terriglobus sp. TaxID=1889013 RepID=UPI003B00B5B9